MDIVALFVTDGNERDPKTPFTLETIFGESAKVFADAARCVSTWISCLAR